MFFPLFRLKTTILFESKFEQEFFIRDLIKNTLHVMYILSNMKYAIWSFKRMFCIKSFVTYKHIDRNKRWWNIYRNQKGQQLLLFYPFHILRFYARFEESFIDLNILKVWKSLLQSLESFPVKHCDIVDIPFFLFTVPTLDSFLLKDQILFLSLTSVYSGGANLN